MDIPTITSSIAMFHLLEYAGKFPDYDIDYLPGPLANRLHYWLYTKAKKYDLVIYYGHGTADRLIGTDAFISVVNKKNIWRAKNAAFSTMACYSAKDLGEFAVGNGTRAYIGTVVPYYAAFKEKERNYLQDWCDYSTIKEKMLLEGSTFTEALKAFKERCTYYMKIYEQKLNYRNYDWYYMAVKSNRDNTVLIGNQYATIYD